jgi:K(+)-stimulated pyrophosphate-energized sodium pump
MEGVFLFFILTSILGIVFAFVNIVQILKQEDGNKRMREVSSYIRRGAMAYLKKQYTILSIYVVVLAILLAVFLKDGPMLALAFVAGSALSAFTGFMGMNIATIANKKTAQAATRGLHSALGLGFSAGLVTSMLAVGLGLLGVTVLYLYLNNIEALFGFALGASSVALFSRVGGGIYTKAADIGADLVGKVEKRIPEDDPRNPAVIADNVGDNVGDIAGMGADLFESYVDSIIAAMAIGALALGATFGTAGVVFPLMIAAVGILASIAASFFVRFNRWFDAHDAFQIAILITSVLIAVVMYFLTVEMFGNMALFWAIVIGLATGWLVGYNTDYYTSEKGKYTKEIADTSQKGIAPVFLKGIVVGMQSIRNTLLFIALAIILSFYVGATAGLGTEDVFILGLYAVAIAAVAMLSTLGVSLAVDAFGPVADNAGGIAEMSSLPRSVRKVTDELDAAGNTTAAMGKGFAIGSAALTAIALFFTYNTTIGKLQGMENLIVNITRPEVMVGLFIGGMLPFYFCAITLGSVERTATRIVEEVRRQFREIKGLMEGKAEPDYEKCVEISSGAALKEMILPGIVVIASPLLVGILLGPMAVAGLLAGAMVSGVSLAVLLANSGAAWDNAKKRWEMHKEETEEWYRRHAALVEGDTVGDPFKDTSGPSLNILIKLMSIVALIFASLFLTPVIVV